MTVIQCSTCSIHNAICLFSLFLQEMMDQAYDKFNLNIDNIQVKILWSISIKNEEFY